MNNSFMNKYFGPLSIEYCTYFYVLSIFFALYGVMILFVLSGYVLMNFNKLNSSIIMNSIFSMLSAFIIYFANRLLHTMCIHSTR